MTNAVLIVPYILHIGLPSNTKRYIIPAGTTLIPADNLPAGSRIAWWVDELPDSFPADEFLDSWHRNYGLGLEDDAVFLPNYTRPIC